MWTLSWGVILMLATLQTGSGADTPALVFREKDPELQSSLQRALDRPPFKTLVEQNQLSVALVDLSDSERVVYAGVRDDRMRYAASLPKIAILLAVFHQIERGNLRYTPDLKRTLERMIRRSSNSAASRLIERVGFEKIEQVLRDPHYELYDPERKGGLWVGKDYGGDLGRWKRDPINNISHGATARQVARFFVMLDQQSLVSPWASGEMKEILSKPGINHKFVKGLKEKYPESKVYRKSGTWKQWHSDAVLVERGSKKYVAVALMVSSRRGILASLITHLDNLIQDD